MDRDSGLYTPSTAAIMPETLGVYKGKLGVLRRLQARLRIQASSGVAVPRLSAARSTLLAKLSPPKFVTRIAPLCKRDGLKPGPRATAGSASRLGLMMIGVSGSAAFSVTSFAAGRVDHSTFLRTVIASDGGAGLG